MKIQRALFAGIKPIPMPTKEAVRPPKVSNRKEPKDLTTKHLAVAMQNSAHGTSHGHELMQSSLPVDTQASQRIKDSGVTHQDKSLFDVSVSPDWRHTVY